MKDDELDRREPFQVLVLPFRQTLCFTEYAIFQRSDSGIWQGLSGGGEEGESFVQAAQREAMEEGAVPSLAPWYRLQTSSSAPITCIAETVRRHWPADKLIIPIVVFAVDCSGITLALSREHTTMRWVQFREAQTLLHYDADKTAVWEISELVKSPVLMKSI